MGLLRTLIDRYVLAKDDADKDYISDFPTGTLKITTPDGKTTVSMDIVTTADERKARRLTDLLLGGDRRDQIVVEEVDDFLGLTE